MGEGMQARSSRLTAGLGQHQSYSSKYKDRYKTCQGQGLSLCFKTQIAFAGLTPPKLHLDTFKVTQTFFLQNQLFFEMACSALGRDRIDLPRAESSFCHRCHSPLFCAGLQPTRPIHHRYIQLRNYNAATQGDAGNKDILRVYLTEMHGSFTFPDSPQAAGTKFPNWSNW